MISLLELMIEKLVNQIKYNCQKQCTQKTIGKLLSQEERLDKKWRGVEWVHGLFLFPLF